MGIIYKEIPQLVMNDILCDNCGISCKEKYNLEYLNISADWGYDSSELDGENWDFYMCKKCSVELIEKFPNLKNKIE